MKRTIIIRDTDLNKLLYQTIKKNLFDSIETEPLTYQGLQQDIMIEVLTQGRTGSPEFRVLPDLYEQMLWREQNLYDRRYLDWSFTMDYPDGQIYVQSRVKYPREPLWKATFEKL
jgi:hypothetical protein